MTKEPTRDEQPPPKKNPTKPPTPKPPAPQLKGGRPPLTKAEHAAQKRVDKNVIKRMRKR